MHACFAMSALTFTFRVNVTFRLLLQLCSLSMSPCEGALPQGRPGGDARRPDDDQEGAGGAVSGCLPTWDAPMPDRGGSPIA